MIRRHIVGIICVLLTLPDPYTPKYTRPKLISQKKDKYGHVIQQTIRASNHRDATRHLHGVSIEGNKSIVATRTGHNIWNVHIEDW